MGLAVDVRARCRVGRALGLVDACWGVFLSGSDFDDGSVAAGVVVCLAWREEPLVGGWDDGWWLGNIDISGLGSWEVVVLIRIGSSSCCCCCYSSF